MTEVRVRRMHELLHHSLAPEQLEITDDSARHAGHAGARGGAGHFIVRIVSDRFEGLRPLARHRLVYAALAEMMPAEIHALTIDARTPGDRNAR